MTTIPSDLPAEQEDLILKYGKGRQGADPCPVPDCPISAQEHHRLARGIMAENRELRRQVDEMSAELGQLQQQASQAAS